MNLIVDLVSNMAYAESKDYSSDLLEAASAKVDELTFNRIRGIGLKNLTKFQQDKIKDATLAQAKYFDDYGLDAAMLRGVSILDTSISFATSQGISGVSPSCIMHLKQTGLMNRTI